jgi:hypothetical protein
MQKLFRCLMLAAVFTAPATVAAAGDLKLTIAHGRVTLVATDVPVRQILTEWARIGKTTIVNGDKLAGPALTLQLVDVPEPQALDTVLRSASGYVAVQRAAFDPAASVFDRIMILPTSRAPVASASASTPSPFNSNNRVMMPQPVDDDDPTDQPLMPPPGMTPPQQQQPSQPGMAPGVPGGTQQPLTAPRPGMLPAPPAGPPNPYGPQPTVIKPPGGPGGPGGRGGPGGPGGGKR